MTKIDNEQAESNKSLEGKAPVDEVPVGALLRAAREQAGFTIERVAMATRIAQPFIEALEQGDLSQLPGAVFGRGFIRNLCKVYGVDSSEILVAFDRTINPPAPGKGKEVVTPSSVRDEKRHQQLKKGVFLIQPNEWKGRIKALAPHHYLRAKPLIFLVAAVVIGGIVINQIDIATRDSGNELAQNQESESTPVAPASNPTPVAEAPVPVPAQAVNAAVPAPVPVAVPTAPEAPANPPAAPAQATATGDEEETLEGGTLVLLTVKEPVVVKISRDNEKQIIGELAPNSYRYRFKDQLKFYVEDASAVEIQFKGQRVPTSSVKGEPKRFTFQSAESQIAKKAAPGTSLR